MLLIFATYIAYVFLSRTFDLLTSQMHALDELERLFCAEAGTGWAFLHLCFNLETERLTKQNESNSNGRSRTVFSIHLPRTTEEQPNGKPYFVHRQGKRRSPNMLAAS